VNLEPLQRTLGYRFTRPELLREALTHRSHGTPHNERLEFLGDSVLNCAVTAELFGRFPDVDEGALTRFRAQLVRQESLHRIAQALELGQFLLLGEGELKSGGFSRPSILADAVEALLGAVYLDAGFPAVQKIVSALLAAPLATLDPATFGKDSKTRLQEWLMARHIAVPRYAIVSAKGKAHDQVLEVECVVPELSIRTLGSGSTRRMAEQQAAAQALKQIETRPAR
jgi:ribonuclease III